MAHTMGAFGLSSRTRIEQRFRSDGPGSAENDGGHSRWAYRFRELVRLAYTVAESPFQLLVWDEIFVHLNRTNYPSEPGLDQNRLFAGASYQPNRVLRAELGYMNQFVRRYTDPDQVNHVLLMSLYLKVDVSGP
jgi:hypothetical protein